MISILRWLHLLLLLLLLCAANSSQKTESMERLLELGRLRAEDFPLSSDAIELSTAASFPSVQDENNGLFIIEPREIAHDDQYRIYLTDMKKDEVMIFSQDGEFIKSFGRTGQGPGEFLGPSHLLIWNRQILVSDTGNRRVQFFDLDGRFLDKSFKLFKGYHSLAINSNGNIFGAPIYYEYPEDKNSGLLDVLDHTGRVIKSFGTPIKINNKYDYSSLSTIKISIENSNKTIWVAFEKFCVLRKYSFEGTLLAEYEIANALMKKKDDLNRSMINRRSLSNPVPYSIIQAAIFSDESGLFTLVPSPIIEVIHVRNDGKIGGLFWRAKVEDLYLGGLLVRRSKSNTFFSLIRRIPRRSIDILIPKEVWK